MIRTVSLALSLALSATGAGALSCLRPDAVQLFQAARDAKEGFYVVKGRITLLEPVNAPDPDRGGIARTRARLTGLALGQGGFLAPFDREIALDAACLGPWCGSAEGLNEDMIVAVEVTDTGPVLSIGPCRERLVAWDADGEDRVLACYRSGICQPADF
ncbi:MAG: hypothetical protein LJE62_00680 [Silicimonas sp.]|jgi:hypothetical protein|nr:hypothetical protein [Silicimonas sp.]